METPLPGLFRRIGMGALDLALFHVAAYFVVLLLDGLKYALGVFLAYAVRLALRLTALRLVLILIFFLILVLLLLLSVLVLLLLFLLLVLLLLLLLLLLLVLILFVLLIILTAATAGTVWLLVFCMAVYMVLNFRKELKEQCK